MPGSKMVLRLGRVAKRLGIGLLARTPVAFCFQEADGFLMYLCYIDESDMLLQDMSRSWNTMNDAVQFCRLQPCYPR
jgi:hypothetical protein